MACTIYVCSKSKVADLRLCFRICKSWFSNGCLSNDVSQLMLTLIQPVTGCLSYYIDEPHHEKTNILVSDLVDTNQAVQSQRMARGLKFRI